MTSPSTRPRLKDRLIDPTPLLAVELRPPRRSLSGDQAMDAWIDVYHAVQRLSKSDTVVFLTDNAVGTGEEENLNHLIQNLGPDAVRERMVPFLTLKHSLDYCRRYAERARREQFPGLVVLGGDAHDGIARCLDHAWQLREIVRQAHPSLVLGGWVNPHRDAERQVGYLLEHRDSLDYALTQVVSHHDLGGLDLFLNQAVKQGLSLPLIAGVFYYRSARPRTLQTLAQFIPVPAAALTADFAERGLTPAQIAAATVRALADRGIGRVYLSNLDTSLAPQQLSQIATLAGLPDPVGPRPKR